jgi:putative endonuclease
MKGGWVYIMTNRPNGTLYVGVTNDIVRRVNEHRSRSGTFTHRHGLGRLVYLERHDEITGAIQRETNIKKWPRSWKVRLIHRDNPAWRDLYEELV